MRAIVASAAVTALICSRFLLIGASMRPWFGGMPAVKVYPMLYLLTEPPWLLVARATTAMAGATRPLCWAARVVDLADAGSSATAPGYWLGASLGDPHRFGLDLVMPAFFVAMLVSLWQGPRRAVGWVVGGVVAVATAQLFGGFWYVGDRRARRQHRGRVHR